MAGLVPAITDGYAFSFQTRFTNLVDQLVWNAFASNSERLQALLFGDATHRGVEPLVRSGERRTPPSPSSCPRRPAPSAPPRPRAFCYGRPSGLSPA